MTHDYKYVVNSYFDSWICLLNKTPKNVRAVDLRNAKTSDSLASKIFDRVNWSGLTERRFLVIQAWKGCFVLHVHLCNWEGVIYICNNVLEHFHIAVGKLTF